MLKRIGLAVILVMITLYYASVYSLPGQATIPVTQKGYNTLQRIIHSEANSEDGSRYKFVKRRCIVTKADIGA